MKLKRCLLLILMLVASTSCSQEKRDEAKGIWNIFYTKLGLIYIVEVPKAFVKDSIETGFGLLNKIKGTISYDSDHGADIISRGLGIELQDNGTNSIDSNITVLHYTPESLIEEIIDQKELVYFSFDDASIAGILSNGDWKTDFSQPAAPAALMSHWGGEEFEANSTYFQELKDTPCRCQKRLWIDVDSKEAIFEVIFY